MFRTVLLGALKAAPAIVAVFAAPASSCIAGNDIATAAIGSVAAIVALLMPSPLAKKPADPEL